ncbi:MAG: hypothetical protein ACOC5E_00745 [Acidobacteriota bacterium]
MSDNSTSKVLDQLAGPIRRSFEPLLEEPGMTIAELRDSVTDYLDRLDETASRVPSADPGAGREVGEQCLDLLDSAEAADGEEPHPLVQAAIRYFTMAGDAEPDLSAGGFEDDLEVLTAVREELAI